MKAMILAAGRGERMRPLTDHTPKPLLKVRGKSLIVWHLERLARAGFKEIVINHAHLGAQIENALGDGAQWGLKINYSAETTALETAGGIANALHLLGHTPFLVLNADIFTDVDFAALRHALAPSMLAHLVLVDNPPQHAQGDFVLLDSGLFDQKIVLENATSAEENLCSKKLTFSGVGVYHPDLFDGIVRGQAAKLAPLLKLAMQSLQITGQHFQGVWHDIGTPERLQALQ